MTLQQPLHLTHQISLSLIIFIIMSPRRKHANYRPAELMLTPVANTLLVMNKAKLQTQTGAGRIATAHEEYPVQEVGPGHR